MLTNISPWKVDLHWKVTFSSPLIGYILCLDYFKSLLNCVFISGKKMSQQQCMPVFIQMKLDPVWIQHLRIKLTKFVNFYWMLCLNKKNVTSYQLFHATLKGTIHILRRHLHSTQLYLTSQFFTKTGGFHQNKRIYFSSLHLHFDNLVML